jgi:hypothetical protein
MVGKMVACRAFGKDLDLCLVSFFLGSDFCLNAIYQ